MRRRYDAFKKSSLATTRGAKKAKNFPKKGEFYLKHIGTLEEEPC
jgi:hypothetical protein